jgi:HlyD family secretion protein
MTVVTATLLAACGTGRGDYDASGMFEAREVTVSAQGAGQIVRLDVTEGQSLAAGVPVGLVDTLQLHLRREQLSGLLAAARARRLDPARQLAALREQLATGRREQTRFEGLVKDNAATPKQLDDITASVATLEREIAARTETLTGANASLEGEIAAMEAQAAQVEDQIARSVVSSPTDGVVLAKYAEAGELAAAGRPLFKVGDLDNIFIRVYITADQLTELKLGQRVAVFADRGRDDRREYEGTVTWISDVAEFTPKTIQTRDERANLVYAVKIAVRNDGYIKTGMYGDIKLKIENGLTRYDDESD